MKTLQDVKNDLSFVSDYGVVVFGSYAAKKADKRPESRFWRACPRIAKRYVLYGSREPLGFGLRTRRVSA